MTQNDKNASIHQPFDLHLHSNCSDGSDTPAQVVRNAAERDITMLALADHDNTAGVPEAMAEAERLGVRLLPALEMDSEWPHELHILGMDIDIEEPRLKTALQTALVRRNDRNAVIVERLLNAGYDIRPYFARDIGTATRLNIALALVEGGYAADTRDAFVRLLRRGCPGYYAVERFSPQEVISLIRGAGGVPIWAHPFNGHPDPHKLAPQLAELGLMGLEGYHPTLSEGDSTVLTSIARQLGLIVTCGSDYHGAHRPDVLPGQTWRDVPALNECRAFFEARPARKLRTESGSAGSEPPYR